MSRTRVCIQFDECKPHWAEARGYVQLAKDCGLENITLTGDFDAKLTYIYGDVSNVISFRARIAQTSLREGSLSCVPSKYYLEFDASGFEAPCDEGQFLGYGTVITEGDSLLECLENATVDLIDQDGGDFAQREADSDAFQDAIEKAFMAKYPPDGGGRE